MKVNLYDFDNTIYSGDSSFDFFFFCMKRHKGIKSLIPKIIISFIKFKIHSITYTNMKETIYEYFKYIPNIDEEVECFWKEHKANIKRFYLIKNHDNDVIISSGPEFLLKPICDELKILKLIGSRVDPKTGKYDGLDCHDIEKVNRFYEEFKKSTKVKEAYTDSRADIPMLKLAEKQFLVKNEFLNPVDF